MDRVGFDILHTASRRQCPLCNSRGKLVYQNERDRLFGAKGVWNIWECMAKDCKLLWLDPYTKDGDIHKLYRHYYTHHSSSTSLPTDDICIGFIKKIYCRAKQGYWARKYHFQSSCSVSLTDKFLSIFYFFLPNRRAGLDYPFKWLASLHHVRQQYGNLLEIGCGSGDMLAMMSQWGWTCTGLEPDRKAASVACKKGLDVRCGNIFDEYFEPDAFDAIVMHHVFEHMSTPEDVLRKCDYLLRPGGVLLITTPNADSIGHLIFRQHWRGLEVPRHLIIYGVNSMKKAAGMAGMSSAIVFSHGRGGIDVLKQSYCLKEYGIARCIIPKLPNIILEILWFITWAMNLFSPDKRLGEELVFFWVKPPVQENKYKRKADGSMYFNFTI